MNTVECMKSFTTVTYNVLAQRFAHRDRYPLSSSDALDPDRRRARLLARVAELDADLWCLQEVEPGIYDGLRAQLQATHHAAYLQRRRRGDGVAVFARRSSFEWLGHDELRFQAGNDDLALVVRLTVEGEPLHVACTHLAWQPDSTPPAEHVGHQQMRELLAHRDATAPYHTWIFAGDFNATSQSIVLAAALERGMAESCRHQRPWDTCAINGRPRKIDYLLFSAGRLEPQPGVLPKLSRDTALPSLTEPSDHLPLSVDFSPVADHLPEDTDGRRVEVERFGS
jgi:endonuclease/exonuclease/phosphatase family metal-dependent hydrolase